MVWLTPSTPLAFARTACVPWWSPRRARSVTRRGWCYRDARRRVRSSRAPPTLAVAFGLVRGWRTRSSCRSLPVPRAVAACPRPQPPRPGGGWLALALYYRAVTKARSVASHRLILDCDQGRDCPEDALRFTQRRRARGRIGDQPSGILECGNGIGRQLGFLQHLDAVLDVGGDGLQQLGIAPRLASTTPTNALRAFSRAFSALRKAAMSAIAALSRTNAPRVPPLGDLAKVGVV